MLECGRELSSLVRFLLKNESCVRVACPVSGECCKSCFSLVGVSPETKGIVSFASPIGGRTSEGG